MTNAADEHREPVSALTDLSRERHFQTVEIARDLALMDEIEALAQSLPNRRAEAGLGPLPDNAVADAYTAIHEVDP